MKATSSHRCESLSRQVDSDLIGQKFLLEKTTINILDTAVSKKLFKKITLEINADIPAEGARLTAEQVVVAFSESQTTACPEIRTETSTQAGRHDLAYHNLAVFRGAVGRHECSIAFHLGICQVTRG